MCSVAWKVMTRIGALVAFALVSAACGRGQAGTEPITDTSSTTTTVAPTSTTTTTSTSTTTTTEPGPVVLEVWNVQRSPLRAVPGQTYLHNHSALPVEFSFTQTDWSFWLVSENAVWYVKDSSDRLVSGTLAFLAGDSSETLEILTEHDTTRDVEELGNSTFGTQNAKVYDIEFTDEGRCNGPRLLDVPLDDGSVWQILLPGCAWNRVWLIDVSGGTLLAFIADVGLAADPPDQIPDELAPIDDIADVIAELEAAITIGG